MKLIRNQLEKVLIAIGFLTKLPIPGKLDFSSKKLAYGLVYGPLIGLLIGTLLVVINFIAGIYFPAYIVSALVIVMYVYLTGGLHIDGVGDLGDALFSGKSGKEFYKIMKDSRLGTGGMMSIIFVLFLDYLLLIDSLNWKILILLPVAGRFGMLLGSVIGIYPKNYDGLGKIFIDGRTWNNSWIILMIVLVMFFMLFSLKGLIIYFALFASTYILVSRWGQRLVGITGDMLGALVEYSQLAYLFLVYILFK